MNIIYQHVARLVTICRYMKMSQTYVF